MRFVVIAFVLLIFHSTCISQTQPPTQYIRMNQMGFLPYAPKIAAIVDANAHMFEIVNAKKQVVYKGTLSKAKEWSQSGEKIQIADFSTFTKPGMYTIRIPNVAESYEFSISNTAFYNVNNAIIKAFYLNRASIEILPQYAGTYARKAGHWDTSVIVLPSAAGPKRKAGDVISCPKGWYDAGDYNKYIVNSGVTVGTLLLAYENYAAYFDTLTWNIPESSNNIPDILDEIKWNTDWMLTMQDPDDGGVYNKTTDANFCGMIMPHEASVSKRYVVAKGTSASLNFAAVMALSYRIFKPFDAAYAQRCLHAAIQAWNWAELHPNIPFQNPTQDGDYPRITTGGYGDKTFSDEKSWAAAELLIATKQAQPYASCVDLNTNYGIPVWFNVGSMALYSLYNYKQDVAQWIDTAKVTERILEQALKLHQYQENENAYKVPVVDFSWGSNGVLANQGVLFLYAYKITKQYNYLNAALASYDYILGRNATEYSFITGYGFKSTQNVHHRPSEGDNIPGSVPGFVAGGPNGGTKRDCFGNYSSFAAKAYYDATCSYTTNEVAINWQAPLVYLAHGIIAEYSTIISNSTSTLAYSPYSELTFARTETSKEIPIFSETPFTISSAESWIRVTPSSGNNSQNIRVETTEPNALEQTRKGTITLSTADGHKQTITVYQKGNAKNFRVEAESFIRMHGVQTEQTTDDGGGLNVGWINNDDSMVFSIDISQTGTYKLNYRVSSYDNIGTLVLKHNNIEYSRIDINPTGGWQIWNTVSDTAYFTEGIYEVTWYAEKGGFNWNYVDFTFVSSEKQDK
ncbi:MAG TPA: glycoside hydrolase family 9 protein [Bacteroidales bacterium]|nr:glycoside hydrolase family 9 protein [Bacteroidales bacterium]